MTIDRDIVDFELVGPPTRSQLALLDRMSSEAGAVSKTDYDARRDAHNGMTESEWLASVDPTYRDALDRARRSTEEQIAKRVKRGK